MTPRADATRNRARVLDAAEAVFAEQGVGASTEQIARRAGVGIGTVFRHFPTKEALLSAVLTARLDLLAVQAERLAGSGDPGEALFDLIRLAVGQSRDKNTYSAALAAAGIDAVADARPRVTRAVGALLERAQRAGAVRADITVSQVFALLAGATHAAEYVGWDPELSAGTLRVLIDGLRHRPTPGADVSV